jgi:hypothetical protein
MQTMITQSLALAVRLGFLSIAEVDLIGGRRQEGLEAANEGLELAQRTGTVFCVSAGEKIPQKKQPDRRVAPE